MKTSQRQVFTFQNENITFLMSLAIETLEYCPLQYPVVEYLVCLNTRYVAAKSKLAIGKIRQLREGLNRYEAQNCWWLWYHHQTMQNNANKSTIYSFEHLYDWKVECPQWGSNPTPLTFWVSALTARPERQLFSHWSLIQVILESTAHYSHLYFWRDPLDENIQCHLSFWWHTTLHKIQR